MWNKSRKIILVSHKILRHFDKKKNVHAHLSIIFWGKLDSEIRLGRTDFLDETVFDLSDFYCTTLWNWETLNLQLNIRFLIKDTYECNHTQMHTHARTDVHTLMYIQGVSEEKKSAIKRILQDYYNSDFIFVYLNCI